MFTSVLQCLLREARIRGLSMLSALRCLTVTGRVVRTKIIREMVLITGCMMDNPCMHHYDKLDSPCNPV